MLRISKINDIMIKPVKQAKLRKEDVRGFEMFEELYANIFICAKKKSGKSTIIYNILKQCVGRDTRIFIFSATVHKDPTYLKILELFEGKGNTVLTFTSIMDGKTDNLMMIAEMLRDPKPEEPADDEEKLDFIITSEPGNKKRKPKPEKMVAPEVIFVLDDLSKELRSESIGMLLKTNRHYKSKVIISSQYPKDLKPESLKQLDYLLLLGKHTDDKLTEIYNQVDLSIPLDSFLRLYHYATSNPFSFLYIDVNKDEYRKNFNKELKFST